MHYDLTTAICLIGDKEQKSIKPIAHGKKFYLAYLKDLF